MGELGSKIPRNDRVSGKVLVAFSLIGLCCLGLWRQVPETPPVEIAATMALRPTMQNARVDRLPMTSLRRPFARSGGLVGHASKLTCSATSQVSGNAVKEEQLKKMTNGEGFISALDESGGTSPKTLAAYGITDKDYKDDTEMMS